jgi:hypothetical protein
MPRCECDVTSPLEDRYMAGYPYCPLHNPMRANNRGVSGFTTTGPIPPPRDGKGYVLRPAKQAKPAPLDENWMRVAPGTDAAIWRPWSRETGEL